MPKHLIFYILVLSMLPAFQVQQTRCQTDEDCAKSFPFSYHCSNLAHQCRRKPIYQSLGFLELSGLFLIFAFNVATNAIGVSSSGLVFCFLILCFQLTTKDSIPMLKVGKLFAATLNIAFVLARRRADNKNELYMDFDLGAFSVPLVLAGCMAGLLANEFLPGAFLCGVMFLTLLIFTFLTWNQAVKIKTMELVLTEEKKDKESPRHSALNEQQFSKGLASSLPKSLLGILTDNFKGIFLMILATTITIFGNLIKGSEFYPSILGIDYCSSSAFGLYFLTTLLTGLLAFLSMPKFLRAEHSGNYKKIAFSSFFSGVLISVGITGSLAFTSLLIVLGIEPAVVSAISNFMLFFTSVTTVVQFEIAGFLDLTNAVFLGVFALMGAAIGNVLMWRALNKAKGKQAVIPYILVLILLATIFLMPISVYLEYLSNPQFFSFGNLC